jgi:hypothetical protein
MTTMTKKKIFIHKEYKKNKIKKNEQENQHKLT